MAALAALCFLLCTKPAYATETVHTITDESNVFDSSVVIYDTQPGTITWESVPDEWVHENITIWNGDTLDAIRYSQGDYYPGGDASATVLCNNVAKVNGNSVSIRLTFNNITSEGIAHGRPSDSIIGISGDGIWSGFWFFGIDYSDVKVELIYTSTGKALSLNKGWISVASLDGALKTDYVYKPWRDSDRGQSVTYRTSKNVDSYVLKDSFLKHNSDGSWEGTDNTVSGNWEDKPGGKNYLKTACAYRVVDDSPTIRLGTENTRAGMFTISFSPLGITQPNDPTKTAEISK